MHFIELAGAVLLIVIGLVVLVAGWAQRAAPRLTLVVDERATRDPHQLARELGLAHRFGARLVRTRYRPADGDFEIVARLHVMSPTWPLREQLLAYLQPVAPLVHVEELLERVESFSARLRRRARGRAHGRA